MELTEEIKKSVVIFLFENNIEIKNGHFCDYKFFEVFSFEKFPFLKQIKSYEEQENYEFVDSYNFNIFLKYQTIKNLNFKEGTEEIKKILNFINEIVSSDVKYEIIKLKENY